MGELAYITHVAHCTCMHMQLQLPPPHGPAIPQARWRAQPLCGPSAFDPARWRWWRPMRTAPAAISRRLLVRNPLATLRRPSVPGSPSLSPSISHTPSITLQLPMTPWLRTPCTRCDRSHRTLSHHHSAQPDRSCPADPPMAVPPPSRGPAPCRGDPEASGAAHRRRGHARDRVRLGQRARPERRPRAPVAGEAGDALPAEPCPNLPAHPPCCSVGPSSSSSHRLLPQLQKQVLDLVAQMHRCVRPAPPVLPGSSVAIPVARAFICIARPFLPSAGTGCTKRTKLWQPRWRRSGPASPPRAWRFWRPSRRMRCVSWGKPHGIGLGLGLTPTFSHPQTPRQLAPERLRLLEEALAATLSAVCRVWIDCGFGPCDPSPRSWRCWAQEGVGPARRNAAMCLLTRPTPTHGASLPLPESLVDRLSPPEPPAAAASEDRAELAPQATPEVPPHVVPGTEVGPLERSVVASNASEVLKRMQASRSKNLNLS